MRKGGCLGIKGNFFLITVELDGCIYRKMMPWRKTVRDKGYLKPSTKYKQALMTYKCKQS